MIVPFLDFVSLGKGIGCFIFEEFARLDIMQKAQLEVDTATAVLILLQLWLGIQETKKKKHISKGVARC